MLPRYTELVSRCHTGAQQPTGALMLCNGPGAEARPAAVTDCTARRDVGEQVMRNWNVSCPAAAAPASPDDHLHRRCGGASVTATGFYTAAEGADSPSPRHTGSASCLTSVPVDQASDRLTHAAAALHLVTISPCCGPLPCSS